LLILFSFFQKRKTKIVFLNENSCKRKNNNFYLLIIKINKCIKVFSFGRLMYVATSHGTESGAEERGVERGQMPPLTSQKFILTLKEFIFGGQEWSNAHSHLPKIHLRLRGISLKSRLLTLKY
jgi:hypothetical protein